MPLPTLIESVPPTSSIRAEVTVPGSKSITNRALVLAALGRGTTTLLGALWSEDTQVMVECLRRLGFHVDVEADDAEEANRTIRIQGLGGIVPDAGSPGAPLDLHVGNAGTAARFVAALVCLGHGAYRLHGVPRMHERPQAELFAALRDLGYKIDSANDRLPAVIHGSGPQPGRVCEVSVHASSQFASALMLSAPAGGWTVRVRGVDPEELPYVEMTRRLIESFPAEGGEFRIEPDASGGSYFWAAGNLLRNGDPLPVRVCHWPTSGWQIDQEFPRFCASPSAEVISRHHDLGDSIMTAIVLAPFRDHSCRFTDLGRLRLQECERVAALRTELTKCGVKVQEQGDTLTVHPSIVHAAEIETYDDHRMAMCFAVLSLRVPGLRIRNPGCVRKTFPNFFAKLASAPPAGLGVSMLDGQTGRRLSGAELLAD